MVMKKMYKGFKSKNYFSIYEKKQIMKMLTEYRLYPHKLKLFNDDNELIKYLNKKGNL